MRGFIELGGDVPAGAYALYLTPEAAERGQAGPAGPPGPAGPQGPQGDPGQAGAPGPAGAVGPQGPRGDTGVSGAKGDVGPAGPKGDAGVAGPVGPQGPKGDVGPAGPAGAAQDTGWIVLTRWTKTGGFDANNRPLTTGQPLPSGLYGLGGRDGGIRIRRQGGLVMWHFLAATWENPANVPIPAGFGPGLLAAFIPTVFATGGYRQGTVTADRLTIGTSGVAGDAANGVGILVSYATDAPWPSSLPASV